MITPRVTVLDPTCGSGAFLFAALNILVIAMDCNVIAMGSDPMITHEPAMNLWVALAMALVFTVGWIPVFAASATMLAAWLAVSFFVMRRVARAKNAKGAH